MNNNNNNNNSQKPLFPFVSFSNENSEQKNETCFNSLFPLFPSVSTSGVVNHKNDVINYSNPSVLPQCSSYQQNVRLELSEEENTEDKDKSSKQHKTIVIDLSSSDYSNDSSIEIIEDIKKKSEHHKKDRRDKHLKQKKKHKKEKYKKHRSSDDFNKQTRPPGLSSKFDNSFLAYLPKGSANFIEDIPNLRPEDAFRLDRRGDKNNRAFDKLYERYVPKYWHKDIIKLNKDVKRGPKQKIKRYYSSRKLKDLTKNSNFIYPKENLFAQISNLDFIRLSEENFVISSSNESTASTIEQTKFKSLEDNYFYSKRLTLGPQLCPSHHQLIMELTKVFNRDLYEDKTDVDKWINFIHFQDLVYFYGDQFESISYDEISKQQYNGSNSDIAKRHKLCVEKKFDICNKALDFNRRSVKLNLLRLKLLSTFSDELQKGCLEVDGDWKNLCFLFPNAPQIWFEWIYYSLRCERMINFRANNRTRKIFKQAFGSLSKKLLEGQFQSHQIENQNIELVLVNLTFFLTEFLLSIDQTEKAIGMFQALMEFNLYTPDEVDFNLSFEDWFMLFEQFWDSGVSRIGEFGHITDSGWKYFQSQMIKKSVDRIKVKDEQNFKIFATQNLIDCCEDRIITQIRSSLPNDKEQWIKSLCWLHLERMRHSLHWLPASVQFPTNHSMDDIEDPERIVLSDEDIKPFLYRLRKLDSKFYLSIKFLQFLGLPLITNALDSAFSSSRFELEFHFDSIFLLDPQCSIESVSRLFEISKKFLPRFENYSESFILKRYGLETVAMNGVNYGIRIPFCDDIVREYDQVFCQSHQAFLDNVFEKLCHRFKDFGQYRTILFLLWIQYKLKLYRQKLIKVSTVKKFFKEILRQYSDQNESLHLYNVYCCFLFELDIQEAIKTYITTIQTIYQKNDTKIDSSDHDLNIWRIALGFVRNLLNLDSIVHQFIITEQTNDIELLPKSSKSCDLTGIDYKQIALNTLVSLYCRFEPSKLNFDILNSSSSPVQALKAITHIESLWAKRNKMKHLEEVQSMIFLLYLTRGLDKTQEFIEQQLLPDAMCLIKFETQFNIPERFKNTCLERSFYILQIQLMLREYVQTKVITIGKISLKCIRQLINRALISFPDDSLFLAMLAKIETKFTIFTRTRNFFNDYIPNSAIKLQNYLVGKYLNVITDSLTSLNFEEHINSCSIESMYNIFMATLHSEFLILDKSTTTTTDNYVGYDFHNGTINRIRHLFERALNYNEDNSKTIDLLLGRSLAHCPTIWRLFIRFEETERRRKETVLGKKTNGIKNTSMLYRALQMCPNHKPLYLDVIVLEPSLLQECVDIMMDQQLRVRTTIEEIDLFLNATNHEDSNDDKTLSS